MKLLSSVIMAPNQSHWNCSFCSPGGSGCVSGVWQWGRRRPSVAVWRLWWQLPHLLPDPSSARRPQRRLEVPQVSGSGEDKLIEATLCKNWYFFATCNSFGVRFNFTPLPYWGDSQYPQTLIWILYNVENVFWSSIVMSQRQLIDLYGLLVATVSTN